MSKWTETMKGTKRTDPGVRCRQARLPTQKHKEGETGRELWDVVKVSREEKISVWKRKFATVPMP